VLVTNAAEASRVAMVGWAQNHGVTELALPRRLILVEGDSTLGDRQDRLCFGAKNGGRQGRIRALDPFAG
jgi:hypothetical protein